MMKTKPMMTTNVTTLLAAALALTISGAAVAVARQQSGAHSPQQHAQHTQKSDAAHTQKSADAHECPLAAQSGDAKTEKHDARDHAAHGGGAAKGHDAHRAAVNERGERAMGFSQTRTKHHFFLKTDGGVIQVEADDANDAESRDRVRAHLAEIARLFAAGDFRTPLAVHDRVPPGAHEMCRLRSAINYEFEQTERGGRVRIKTRDKDALAAVHSFLRFQIEDHQTGDKLEVTN